jgi:predicted hotdog family 3-hydroxylacyl-ACP dehydratase
MRQANGMSPCAIWAALLKAAADPDSVQAGLAVAARELVLAEDSLAKAMAMAAAALAVPVVMG